MPRIITIDGPAGSGKTTVSRILAQHLGWVYVDTGALYRGLALEVKSSGIDYNDDFLLSKLLETINLELVVQEKELRVLSSGRDITHGIRTPEISMLASTLSAKPQVRAALLGIQRAIAEKENAVFEGRDMGTVVFPLADHKFFLSADLTVRALRRYNENKGQHLDDVEKEMSKRDRNDSERKEAPLRPADNAVMIDSTNLTLKEVVARMIDEIGQ